MRALIGVAVWSATLVLCGCACEGVSAATRQQQAADSEPNGYPRGNLAQRSGGKRKPIERQRTEPAPPAWRMMLPEI